MTDEQRRHIHDITYSTDSRTELAERIVALEDENASLRDTTYAWRTVDRLSRENAKLLELVAHYERAVTVHDVKPVEVLEWSARCDALRKELRIEGDA